MHPTLPDALDLADRLRAVRDQRPLVHNITNFVAMDLSANALLAVGASPAMVHALEEVTDFANLAGALVCNIGTLSPAWVDAMQRAMERAHERRIPTVLDPVGVGATAYRTETSVRLSTHPAPTAIRGNASEVRALAVAIGCVDDAGAGPRGVDAAEAEAHAVEVAVRLSRATGSVVVATGAVDVVTDGARTVEIEGGDPMMTRVTATGCALSALLGGFLAASPDRAFAAAVAAVRTMGLAGERAAAVSEGPGSLRVALLDALHTIEPDDLRAGARIRPWP